MSAHITELLPRPNVNYVLRLGWISLPAHTKVDVGVRVEIISETETMSYADLVQIIYNSH